MDSVLYADEDQIVQVLINLIGNAFKFSPSGADVILSAADSDGFVNIKVTDHGRGVPVEYKDKIFDRFKQVELADSRLKGGTGLGLAICKAIVEGTEPSAYLFSNDQEEYGYVGAKWLFEKLGGEGAVYYMRGAAGTSADTDRDTGFRRAMAEYPGITLAGEVFTGWDIATGAQQINEFLASGTPFDGIWTSGIDSTIVDALLTAGVPLVPVVGADNAGFVNQLATVEGLVGAAVTNPGSVGGAGVTMALKVLNGEQVPQQVLITPEVWDNTTPEGQAAIAAANDPAIDPTWPLGISIPDWTTYTKEQIIGCLGPGGV